MKDIVAGITKKNLDDAVVQEKDVSFARDGTEITGKLKGKIPFRARLFIHKHRVFMLATASLPARRLRVLVVSGAACLSLSATSIEP